MATFWSSNPEDEDVTPPWGALPIEQFLLENWSASSQSPPAEQYTQSVVAFLDLADIPAEWCPTRHGGVDAADESDEVLLSRTPEADEVRTILTPWRPPRLRAIAAGLWTARRSSDAVILRTYYARDEAERALHDETLEGWLAEEEGQDTDTDEEKREWRVLDDERLFGFGEEEENPWERMFELLPELTGPSDGLSRVINPVDLQNLQARIRGELEETGYEVPAGYMGDRAVYMESLGDRIQVLAETTYLVVADREAFETGKVRVITLDGFGNLVRQSRYDAENVHYIKNDWEAGRRDSGWWEEGELGPKYKADGEIGITLYGVWEFFDSD